MEKINATRTVTALMARSALAVGSRTRRANLHDVGTSMWSPTRGRSLAVKEKINATHARRICRALACGPGASLKCDLEVGQAHGAFDFRPSF